MSDSIFLDVVLAVGLALVAGSFAYAAYWALAIRRGLVMRVYRNQAFGLSAISLYFVLFVIQAAFFPVNLGAAPYIILVSALFDLGWVATIMLWINVTISIARRSDPFERDVLHYSSTKFVWAGGFILLAVIALVYEPIAADVTVSAPIPVLYHVLGNIPYLFALLVGAIFLLVGGLRSRDRTLQIHLRWFGLFAASLAVSGVILVLLDIFSSGQYGLQDLGGELSFLQFVVLFTIAGYCLYRCARSLAPTTSHLELPDATARRPGSDG